MSLQAECSPILQDLNQLTAILHHFARLYSDKATEIEDATSGPHILIRCPLSRTGTPGRPLIMISKAQIETLIELGYSYVSIARMFGIKEHYCADEVIMPYLLVVLSRTSVTVILILL